MRLKPVTYRVASLTAGRRLLRDLAKAFPSRPFEPQSQDATILETFDWRICRDDGMLALEPGQHGFLMWTSLAGELRHRCRISVAPAFAWDLPDGPLRNELESIVEMRRLLPLATVERKLRGINIVDDLDKTVCSITLESGTATAPDSTRKPQRLAPTLRVAAPKGYRRLFQDVVRRLDTEFDAARSEQSELHAIAAAVGREPCDVPPKQTYAIRRRTRADIAMKAIHRALLDTIRRNEAGMRADLDSEFLHDARVAVRRTRSALSQVPDVFPVEDVRRFKREFRWLGGITGPTRDLDVYLLKIPAYRAALHERHRADLDPLVGLLRDHQQTAQRRMVAAIDSPRFGELLSAWQAFLEAAPPRSSGLANAMRPIEDVAGERIRRAWRKAVKRGRQIDPDSPVDALHRLRIDCKKLRYLLEFFGALYDKQAIKGLIAALKRLQTNLGDLNDLAVQIEALRGFKRELAQRKAGKATLLAIDELVAQLDGRRTAERARFESQFADFLAKPVSRTFRRLFDPTQAFR